MVTQKQIKTRPARKERECEATDRRPQEAASERDREGTEQRRSEIADREDRKAAQHRQSKAAGERDREATERRLLETVGEMVAAEGFEQIGINAVAARAGVSKILIYRYFGSVEGLLAAYVRQHDFWLNFPLELPAHDQVPAFIKRMFRGQADRLRHDATLKRLYRWELSCDNPSIARLREQREKVGLQLVEAVSSLTGRPHGEIAAMASVLSASITYLAMLGDFCPVYNGLSLDTDAGWDQLAQGIERLVDRVFPPQ